MSRLIRLLLVCVAVAALALPAAAQQAAPQAPPNSIVQLFLSKGYLTPEEAAHIREAATPAEANNRMLQLFLAKGMISQDEYNSAAAPSPAPSISATGIAPGGARMMNAGAPTRPAPEPAVAAPSPVHPAEPARMAEWPVSVMNIGYDPSDGTAADASVIPAIAPVRVLPIGVPRDPKGILPDIKLGSGAMLNVYGFLKASAIYDSTNSGGPVIGNNDFPLPLLENTGGSDTGPNSGSQFHIKARSSRMGVNFFYPISGPNITLTGRLEFDWEGDFTTVNNRNVSSVRSSQLSLRQAWMRMDTKLGTVPWFAEFGQDWTLISSSTLMDVFETTQSGAFFGNTYERIPQFKTGLQFSAGKLKIQPEFVIALGAFGDNNLNSSTTNALFGAVGTIPTGFQDQTREGAVLGPASGEPGVEGRIVFDFPLNSSWKGVPNAEIIVSGGHAEATEIVPVQNLPTAGAPTLTLATGATPNGLSATACSGTAPAAGFSLRCYFPTGLTMNIPQNIFTTEVQLPTPWVTITSKYYKGGDLRFLFGGQLNTAFRDTTLNTIAGNGAVTVPGGFASVLCTFGTVGCTGGSATTPGVANLTVNNTVLSLSGDTVTFSHVGGGAEVNPYRPIRGQGGFVQLAFPLSRIFGANPDGRNAGWSLYVAYGVDSAFARDVRNAGTSIGGNGLQRSDYAPVSLRYKINRWAQIVNEVTWYDTRTADANLVLFRGVPAHVNHDWRNEFGTIFTF